MKLNFKQAFLKRLRDRSALASLAINTLYWLLVLTGLELLLHLAVFHTLDKRFLFVLGFSGAFACGLALITSFIPKRANFIVSLLLTVLVLAVYVSQLIYYFAFGTLYSLAHIQQGGAALTSFWKETLATVANNLWWVLAGFLPLVPIILLRIFRKQTFAPSNALWRLCLLVLLIALQLGTTACLSIGGTGLFSNHYFYYNDLATTDQTAQRFGLLTALRLDLTGSPAQAEQEEDYYVPLPTEPEVEDDTDTSVEYGYNILDIDFDHLNTLTENEKLKSLNSYIASLSGTKQNPYTGMLSDYNLIVLCAESFATGVIDPELTPTLYKLANEGIIFNNYYNSYLNNTTDGEYALCTGLHPDASRYKEVASFYASRNSYLPYCLGNIFKQQKNIQSYGYHYYYSSFYGRNLTHPNMGYTMQFPGEGLTYTYDFPSSDLDLMMQSVDDYLTQDQFHAYYMTFSGHMFYSIDVNPMAKKNYHLVKDLKMDYASKCYLACNIELDRALEYLMTRLEEAGVADKTAIVMASDHYPYGLTDKQYESLMGEPQDKFQKYKSTLFFWVGGLEENIVVDEYCCNVDILPTILNLWGFEYDSRMLTGTDVFSNGTHIAILQDGSFLNDKVWLDAGKGEVRYLVDQSTLPEGYVENMVKFVQTKFTVSKDILNYAYYNFVFEKGNVYVGWGSWGSWVPKPKDPDPTTPSGPGTDPTAPSEPAPSEPVPSEPVPSEPVPSEPVPDTPTPDTPTPDTPTPDTPTPDTPTPEEDTPPA